MNKAFRPGAPRAVGDGASPGASPRPAGEARENRGTRAAGPIERALEARLPSLAGLWRSELSQPGRGSGAAPSALSPSEIESVGSALLRLQRGLTGERGLAGEPYMEDANLLGAYLLYYWPVSYLEASLALASLAASGREAPRRVLDLGAGPGPLSAALLDAGAKELCLVDSSPRALALARRILEPGSPTGAGSRPAALTTLSLDLEDAGAILPEGPFDAVVMGRAVNELWKEREDRLERRLALLEAARDRLAPGGFLLVLEPAVLLSSRDALGLRDRLAASGSPILGPCLRQGPCPALSAGPGHTCHGEYPWSPPEPLASLARRAGLDRSSVKTTWFAAGRPAGPPGAGEAEKRPLPAVPPPGAAGLGESFRALVVSEPMLNKAGRTRYLLCGEEGRRAFSAARGDGRALAAGFWTLSRYDIVRITRPEARPGAAARREAAGGEAARGEAAAIGFGPETLLEIERAPRP